MDHHNWYRFNLEKSADSELGILICDVLFKYMNFCSSGVIVSSLMTVVK